MFKKISLKTSLMGSSFRLELKCVNANMSESVLGMEMKSVEADREIRVVLKKRGCFDEDGKQVFVRVGDTLTVYIVRSV